MVKSMGDLQGKDLELWVVPKDGAPRSLGVIPNVEKDTLIRITSADPRVRGAQSIAITIEPHGGSPTGGPTGPRVLSGAIVPVRKT
jgi:anti-sigma-K factor RskA